MKKFFLLLLVLFLLFAGYLLFNTFTFSSQQIKATPVPKEPIPFAAREHLAAAIAIPTISYDNKKDIDSAAFYRFRDFIKTTYPLSDSLLEVIHINEFSLLYKWPGTNPALKPMILSGHLDVVPIPEENLKDWAVPPFAGVIKDGIIWGRGAIDDKNTVIGIMEATELLLHHNFKPERTFYFCFGHDEETGGYDGALHMATYLRAQGVEAEFVLDEGYAITRGLVPGIKKDVALIGTAEKGFVTLTLTVTMKGGHSSIPEKETAIDVLSEAIIRLREHPFPAKITRPLSDFMQHAGPEMPFLQKMAFANPEIFKPLIFNIYGKTPEGNALIRTTAVPTIITGGTKENIIPYVAKGYVNFRMLPGTTVADVKKQVIKIIDDPRIAVSESFTPNEPSAASGITAFGYQAVSKTIKELFPQALTAPNLVPGSTDARHYYAISKDVYRFTPFYLDKDNINSFHGVNERISVEDFENSIRFYIRLIQNTAR